MSRKRKDCDKSLSKAKKSKKDVEDKSIFGITVKAAGFVLKSEEKPNQINCGKALFQKNLKIELENNDNPDVVDEFIEAFLKHVENPIRFKMCMFPTMNTDDCETSAPGGTQDSLVRLLLGVDTLQPKLAAALLEKLVEFNEDDVISSNGNNINMASLILQQFRWLDQIIQPKELIEKMFELVGISSFKVQQDIISCLPEVIEDSEQPDVAKQLKELIDTNGDLTVTILDTLSNLNISQNIVREIRQSVISGLASIGCDDIPVAVKFLLQSMTPQDAVDVTKEMRLKLDFSSFSLPSMNNQSQQTELDPTKRGNEALTLDILKSEIMFNKTIGDAWMKVIIEVTELQVIDVFVLLILHQIPSRKKAIESLVRNKIRAGNLTEALIRSIVSDHTQLMRENFKSLLSLAQVLLCSAEPAIGYFAVSLYKHAFVWFDAYCRQEILSSLVTHIGSGQQMEINSSLNILVQLSEDYVLKLTPYAIFVKGVLDYLDNLTMPQIRKLYSALSILGFRNQEDAGNIQDDMHIIIRKQLSNNDAKYKRMGIIGAIMIVKALSYKESSEHEISEDAFKQVTSLLQLVQSSCIKSADALCLFLDELSCVIESGSLVQKVEGWINDYVIKDFEDDYVVDYEPGKDLDDCIVPVEALYSLDDQSESGIAINLLPLIAKSKERNPADKKIISPIGLCPQYRLLRICEKNQNGADLENISATLGCPLIMPASHVYDKYDSLSPKEKEIICLSLFHAANWFIETTNAFTPIDDPEVKAKIISRLQHITQIRQLLKKVLPMTPNFKPPPACFDVFTDSAPSNTIQTTSGGSKKSTGKKRKGKTSDKDKENNPDDTSVESQCDKESSKLNSTVVGTQKSADHATEVKADFDLSAYRIYFREIDMVVFSILQTKPITEAVLDTECNTKDVNTLNVQTNELCYLMNDFNAKLKHALVSSTSKRNCFLKVSTDKNIGFSQLDRLSPLRVAKAAIKLLPTLCDNLEGSSSFFKTLMEANDGLLDGPGSSTEEAAVAATCFQLLLQSFKILLSWNGFQSNENSSLLKQTLKVFSSCAKGERQNTMTGLYNGTFDFVMGHSEYVPNLKTAVSLSELLSLLCNKADSPLLNEKIAQLSKEYLQRDWDLKRDKTADVKESLQVLLSLYLSNTPDKFDSLEHLGKEGLNELCNADKNASSPAFPTLTRATYTVFYKTMLVELLAAIKAIPVSKTGDANELRIQRLLHWSSGVKVFYILVNLIKVFDGRSNLNSVMKYGRQIVEVFLKNGMPLLDQLFRSRREDVQGLLKNLQISTRSLHHICGHSKIIKDICLTNQVPLVKRTLETFVYRVKVMLTVNKCREAFWLGNLKNRDLKGEEILSQNRTQEEEDETADDVPDELLDDGSESEVEVADDDDSGADRGKKDETNVQESFSEQF